MGKLATPTGDIDEGLHALLRYGYRPASLDLELFESKECIEDQAIKIQKYFEIIKLNSLNWIDLDLDDHPIKKPNIK